MVGAAGMSPLPIELNGKTFADETEEQTHGPDQKRFEDIGIRLMNRTAERLGGVSATRGSAGYAAQFIGEAFVTAYNLILAEPGRRSRPSPNDVLEEKEIYGDDLVRLLDEQHFVRPEIDWTDESIWPKFMNYSRDKKDDRDKDGPVEFNA